RGIRLPLSELDPIQPLLHQLAIAGAHLTEPELGRLRSFLATANELVRFVRDREDTPQLQQLVQAHSSDPALHARIDKVLGPDNRLRDSASPRLAELRASLREVGTQLRTQLNRLLQAGKQKGHFDAATEVTVRNERLVLPVPGEHRSKYEGFVQDVSGSGQTFFIEPASSLPMNNRQRELSRQEQNEVLRILQAVSAELHSALPTLRSMLQLVASLDQRYAAARLGMALDGTTAYTIAEQGSYAVQQARHPLLCLQRGPAAVVPFSLLLDAQQRILLISGPNAGGKSVTMTAVGLLQLMAQCGLPLPTEAGARFPWLHKLFVHMGDDQNLQSDLSTYTSHLVQMRHAYEELDAQSLILIDEFGTGTDPALGGPIAQALLERFVASGALGVINTHYSLLKEYAHHSPGILNGALAFDLAALSPTYQLVIGQPGSSYALEIARRVGLPEALIARATELAGKERGDTEQLLTQLRQQQQELLQLRARYATEVNELEKARKEYVALQQQASRQKKETLELARRQAEQIVKEANARIEATIRGIKEAEADKAQTRQLRQELKDAFLLDDTARAKKRKQHRQQVDSTAQSGPLAVGDLVLLDGSGSTGKVLELGTKGVLVAFGELQTRVAPTRLRRVGAATPPAAARHSTHAPIRNTSPPRQLDLRGMRPEQAIAELEKLLDRLLLAGYPAAEILHGKGTGALRSAIRLHLRTHYPQFRIEEPPEQQGGSGITHIHLADGQGIAE
ncbi:MAG: endonuclease MutS2, partial [Sphingobacteriia bacterium]